jgi:hypothetical protein
MGMRVYWQPTIDVMKEGAAAAGHRLAEFGPVEGQRIGLTVRRTKCLRCGSPFYIAKTAEGLITAPKDFGPCEPTSLRATPAQRSNTDGNSTSNTDHEAPA